MLLVSYKGESEAVPYPSVLRFFMLKLDGLLLVPTCITYPIPTPSSSLFDGTGGGLRIDFSVTPVMEPTQSDYIYLVCGPELALFSLNTGQRVQPKMSDADKGFSFMMRGLVPGTSPFWKFEVPHRYIHGV